MFIVFDLDGTLANTDHRAHFVDRTKGKPDWRAFYAACDADTPHHHVIVPSRITDFRRTRPRPKGGLDGMFSLSSPRLRRPEQGK